MTSKHESRSAEGESGSWMFIYVIERRSALVQQHQNMMRKPIECEIHGYGLRRPRKNDDELREDSIEELQTRRTDTQSAAVDEDEAEAAEGFELPGADLSDEELQVTVLP